MEANHLFIILAKSRDLCLYPLLKYFDLHERASCKAFHFQDAVEILDDQMPLTFQPQVLVIPENVKIPPQLKKYIAQAKASYQMAARQYNELEGRGKELSFLAGHKLHPLRLTYDRGRSNLLRQLKAMADAYHTRNESAYYAAYHELVVFYQHNCIYEAKLTLVYLLNTRDELRNLLTGPIDNEFCEIAPAFQQIFQEGNIHQLLTRYCAVNNEAEAAKLRQKICALLICEEPTGSPNALPG